jgi:Phosphodiester glycosidase
VVPTDLLVVPALLALYGCYRLRRRLGRSFLGVLLPLVAIPLVLFAGYWLWYFHRPQPGTLTRELFPGIAYHRESRTSPRPLALHVVTIDLDTPGLEFLVTPGEPIPKGQLHARTTSQFVREFDVDVAINASFFYPFHSDGPFDYYPHVGDPVNAAGSCASRRRWYSAPAKGYYLLAIREDNRVTIGGPGGDAWNAVSGKPILLKDGQICDGLDDESALHPRTAVVLDRSGRRMFWLVIDGRQPRYSEGVTVQELAEVCRELGGWNALALDGGGSTTLVVRGDDGKAEVLNFPIHGNHPPGIERPVANHLGVRVRPR